MSYEVRQSSLTFIGVLDTHWNTYALPETKTSLTVCCYHVTYAFQSESTLYNGQFGQMIKCSFKN